MIVDSDHLVLMVLDEAVSVRFYCGVLGMTLETFGAGRKAFLFGSCKTNLHVKGHEFEPKAKVPTPGALDLCFLVDCSVEDVMKRLEAAGIPIEGGPVRRTGACGPLMSVYVRDPDGNLIELAAQQ